MPDYNNFKNEFISIKEIRNDNFKMYCAFLGLTNLNSTNNFDSVEIINKDSDTGTVHIEKLFEILEENNYNVLIDSGAFFKDYSSLQLIKLISKHLDKKHYIFIDNKNKKRFITKIKTLFMIINKKFMQQTNYLYIMTINILSV